MRDARSRLERLEQEAQRPVEDGDRFPSMQALLQSLLMSPQADQHWELECRLLSPDTTPQQADRIRQALDDWTLEVVMRLADGQPIDDCRLDTSGLPPEWFGQSDFGRYVGPSTE